VTSLLVNQGIKRLIRRPRPSVRNVPAVRRVPVAALTTSFPSGHAGSAAAFASGVACELPAAGPPLALAAATVGLSRVYVGVHYPVDILVGAGLGAGVGQLTRRIWPVLPTRPEAVPPTAHRQRVAPNPDGRGVAIVINPRSGSELDEDALRSKLPRARIILLGEDEDLAAALRAAADVCEVLGIAGGDGSAALAAEIALECDRPLLVLPGGTLNHLARDLRVEHAAQAIDALASGELVGIDVATIDGRLFVNTAGFGAYPELLATSDRLQPWLGRWGAHSAALLKTLISAAPLEVALDGTQRSIWMGYVGNCRHEPEGLGPTWRPRLDDGKLDVRLLFADLPHLRLRALLAALSGRLPRSDAYLQREAPQLRVESAQRQLRLSQDGEHFEGHGSFTIEKPAKRLLVHAPHEPRTG
jgi:diacylglycerol kinase family enzyme